MRPCPVRSQPALSPFRPIPARVRHRGRPAHRPQLRQQPWTRRGRPGPAVPGKPFSSRADAMGRAAMSQRLFHCSPRACRRHTPATPVLPSKARRGAWTHTRRHEIVLLRLCSGSATTTTRRGAAGGSAVTVHRVGGSAAGRVTGGGTQWQDRVLPGARSGGGLAADLRLRLPEQAEPRLETIRHGLREGVAERQGRLDHPLGEPDPGQPVAAVPESSSVGELPARVPCSRCNAGW